MTEHLMTDPVANSGFCFPRPNTFLKAYQQATLMAQGNNSHCFPLGQLFSAYYFNQTYKELPTLF